MSITIKSEIRNEPPKASLAESGSEKEVIWNLLKEIPDPEIPVISITDLGVLRDVTFENEKVVVTITPTYSGCPAMKAIESEILSVLKENGFEAEVKTVYSPVWTTDWMSEETKEKLREYGISPPLRNPKSEIRNISCPRCNSSNSELISQFGSTACKALYRCMDCKEPFDYFKCH
jgi:ring-1,2-phenylacetyl-CoA epoxidase subunit PaaD